MSGSSPSQKVTVVLADDHQMFRDALRACLEASEISVIGEASDGQQAVSHVLRLQPIVTIMDVSMPELDGISATRAILEADSRARIVVLTMHSDPRVLDDALRSGALGYCTKTSPFEELLSIVRRVAAGDVAVSQDMVGVAPDRRVAMTDHGPLSVRETEVMRLVARGRDNAAIANELFISARTVKNHLASIYDKLSVNDKTQALIKALRLGLIELE